MNSCSVAVDPATKAPFVYSCMQTKLTRRYNEKNGALASFICQVITVKQRANALDLSTVQALNMLTSTS